ncbi:hypothetical protein [Streptomyces roseoverticillatus]|uniref:hypothetical protein n=1 Tax=Streptomyces roseoverticillatus TaxID=66429 RepID=UPI0004BEA0E1|nr:hypothetical protein [Streptomyces roseoverticillatus]
MAEANSNADARPAHVHPKAKPGYGKRTAPDQARRTSNDFAHLPAREASIAAFIDRLPEGAAMDAKTLAAHIPDYGQAACRTALHRLTDEGHLRRVTERTRGDDGSNHWVTRTYFSRTPRDDDWWADFQAGNVPESRPRPEPSPEPRPEPRPEPPEQPESQPRAAGKPPRSQAYEGLALAGRMDPRMTLSARDCKTLEPLAEEWLARGASQEDIARELTAGLPPEVHHAASVARYRLQEKLPPERPAPEPAATGRVIRIMECMLCRAPGRPEALPGGFCRDCRSEPAPPVTYAIPPQEVRRRADAIRASIRTPERSTT